MVEAKEELVDTVSPLRAKGVQLPLQPKLATSELCSLAVKFIRSERHPMVFHCLLKQTVQHTSRLWSGGRVACFRINSLKTHR